MPAQARARGIVLIIPFSPPILRPLYTAGGRRQDDVQHAGQRARRRLTYGTVVRRARRSPSGRSVSLISTTTEARVGEYLLGLCVRVGEPREVARPRIRYKNVYGDGIGEGQL